MKHKFDAERTQEYNPITGYYKVKQCYHCGVDYSLFVAGLNDVIRESFYFKLTYDIMFETYSRLPCLTEDEIITKEIIK